jgi:hypothetical protein
LETVPTNESQLLALGVRISFRGKVQRKDAPILRASIEDGATASLEHHVFLRLSTKGSNARPSRVLKK